MTTVAKVLQWPFTVVWPFARVKSRAMKIAQEIDEVGYLRKTYFKQHIGFARLIVRNSDGKRSWCFDIQHKVHFRGRFGKVPDLEHAEYIRFRYTRDPLYGGNPYQFASYLAITDTLDVSSGK